MRQDIKDLQDKLFALQKIDAANEIGAKAAGALHLAIAEVHGKQSVIDYVIKAGILFKCYKTGRDVANILTRLPDVSANAIEAVKNLNNQCFKEAWLDGMRVPFKLATDIIDAVEAYDEAIAAAINLVDDAELSDMKRNIQ